MLCQYSLVNKLYFVFKQRRFGKPDFQAMMCAHSSGVVRGVIVTLQGTESNGCVDSSGAVYDFVSRYFAPWVGIPEDPVTGE